MGSTDDKIFDKEKDFWDNYLRGRPKPPAAFFRRIFDYHQARGGLFGTIHDVGAGNGPFASILAARFEHVILSDVAASSIELARQRLGTSDKFTYRVAKMDEMTDLGANAVDMVFATNVMHFAADQHAAMAAIAKQLRPGGTFAGAVFGPGRFADARLQSLWAQICQQGGRELLHSSNVPEQTALVMARTDGLYNVAPLDPNQFETGAFRVHFNMADGGLTPLLPSECTSLDVEPYHSGLDDVLLFEEEEELKFEMDAAAVREHMLSFPFVDPSRSPVTQELLQEVGVFMAENNSSPKFRGSWPAKLILATVKNK